MKRYPPNIGNIEVYEHGFNLKFTEDFDLFTLCYSETAKKNGIVNLATDKVIIDNLKKISVEILQPIVDHFKLPLTVTSGYRSDTLNKMVGGVENSQHRLGQAVDFLVGGIHNDELACWIKSNLHYDQLILECYNPSNNEYGWVHCSYVSNDKNRKNILTYDGSEYHKGLLTQA